MWKVQFQKGKNTITLFVAEDALIYPYTTFNAAELKQFFNTQLGKLAFLMERTLHPDENTTYSSAVFIRSCFVVDENLSELFCYYEATVNKEQNKPTATKFKLKNIGKDYTDRLNPACLSVLISAGFSRSA